MNNDFEIVKEKLENADAPLPESLKPEAVVKRLETEGAWVPADAETTKEKKHKKGIIRRFTPLVAAAAVIALLIGVLPKVTRNKPSGTNNGAPDRNVTQVAPDDYSAVAAALQKNKARSMLSDAIDDIFGGFGYFGWSKATDRAGWTVEEDYAEEPAAESAIGGNVKSNSAPVTAQNADGASERGSYSELNTVEKDVDETDVIRTDGKYIYVLKNAGSSNYYYRFYGAWDMVAESGTRVQTFTIVSPNDGDPAKLSETKLTLTEEGAAEVVRERAYTGFYIYGNYAVLTGSEIRFTSGGMQYDEEGQYWDFYGNVEIETRALVTVYDITDKAAPVHVRDLWFSGNLLETRVVNGRLLAVSLWSPDFDVITYEDAGTFVPCAGSDGELVPAGNITVDEEATDAEQYLTVSLFDLNNVSSDPQSASVLGSAWDIYCSKNAVYVYGSHSRYRLLSSDWLQVLDVHKLDITGDAPAYIGKASFEDAEVLNDYALNEYNGNLRLALHFFKDWTNRDNAVVVLGPDMAELGRTEAFGKGEDIKSVRYDGDLAYVVTFRNTDPLFAIDLSDPANPVIRGEAKLPGFSAYLHQVGGYMVGVGYGGTEEGLDGSGKISLFDVTDPDNPTEIDQIVLDDTTFMTDHKAFVPVGDDGFIVLYSYYNDYYWVDAVDDAETDEGEYETDEPATEVADEEPGDVDADEPSTATVDEEPGEPDGYGRDESKYGCGWIYVRVENDRLVKVSSAERGSEDANRALFIGENVYFYTHAYGYFESDDEYVPDSWLITGYAFASGAEKGSLTL